MFHFEFDEELKKLGKIALAQCEQQFVVFNELASLNQKRMLEAFVYNRVSESHFSATTGYGYGDSGRETLDKVFATYFGAEDALVRHSFVNGTHALSTALFGVLRPGDKFLSVTGMPYDSLHNVIGINDKKEKISKFSLGSLKDFKIDFDFVEFDEDFSINYDKIREKIQDKKIKLVYVQRSRGYSFRNSVSVYEIKKIVDFVKNIRKNLIIIVDNCYGEFTEQYEPSHFAADLVVGSLIKNPGGGIARGGGYICGKRALIELCANRLTTVGAGKEVGATFGLNREMFLGFFNAPFVTAQALKTAVFAASLFEILGYEVFPKRDSYRADIVQAIKLGSPEKLVAFCKGLQSASPVDSFVTPQPWAMPNYNEEIIMAAGTFTNGASIEVSADGPMREPFAVWVQGGINFESAKIAILNAATEVLKIHDA